MQGNMNFETFSEETLQVDEVKIEEHEDLNVTIYNNNVSHFFMSEALPLSVVPKVGRASLFSMICTQLHQASVERYGHVRLR